jgi:D-sedoheptulose 7-phosphate isomerase
MRPFLERALKESAALAGRCLEDQAILDGFESVSRELREAFLSGRKALICGNGGSLADAVHFAEEWTGRFRDDRRPWPVIPLAEPGHLTCVANDFGFDQVFARLVLAYGQPGDLLFLLSTSGQSPNLLHAARAASDRRIIRIGLLGRQGGELRNHCDIALCFPGETSDRIQELHMLFLHALVEAVETGLDSA